MNKRLYFISLLIAVMMFIYVINQGNTLQPELILDNPDKIVNNHL